MTLEVAFEVGRLYGPLDRLASAIEASASDVFIKLPGVVGYFPMSIVTDGGAAVNHAQPGIDVFQVGTVPLADDGNAYRHTGNGTNYLRRTGQFALTGAEVWIAASLRGFTIGGWFMIDGLPASNGGLISRGAAPPDRGYALGVTTTSLVNMVVSGDGASFSTVTSPLVTTGVWHFIVGRFIPSVEVAVFVDGDKTTNEIAIPASQYVSSADFEMGRKTGENSRIVHAKMRDIFICQTALSDNEIEAVRTATAP